MSQETKVKNIAINGEKSISSGSLNIDQLQKPIVIKVGITHQPKVIVIER